MNKITPSLWFDNNVEEAIEFYSTIFEDSEVLSVQRIGEGAPDAEGGVVVASFRLNGQDFIAINGGPEFAFTEAISFTIDCTSQEEVDFFWKKLTAGGEPSQCGWLKDKFGLSWQVVPAILIELLQDEDPEKSNRVIQAMLQMTRIDIAKLEVVYAGQ